jgi:hypothetical protein
MGDYVVQFNDSGALKERAVTTDISNKVVEYIFEEVERYHPKAQVLRIRKIQTIEDYNRGVPREEGPNWIYDLGV